MTLEKIATPTFFLKQNLKYKNSLPSYQQSNNTIYQTIIRKNCIANIFSRIQSQCYTSFLSSLFSNTTKFYYQL